jgi:uncharacterized damage-inducible protein DinB
MENQLVNEFKKRVFEESYLRIFKCLESLDDRQIWFAPNENIPSIGNLILHLTGNMRQWVLTGLGNLPDNRDRNSEFVPHQDIRKCDLVFLMENVRVNIREVLLELPNDFEERQVIVQGFHETGFTVLTHVMEHFSYHTGQITTLTKLQQNMDIGYYQGFDLNKISSLN